MRSFTPQQLKKALVAAGFEVFRTTTEDVVLADRVRENLILDSGVRLRAGPPLQVRIVLRAQKGDFPTEGEPELFERVRKLSAPVLVDGFHEVSAGILRVADPSDSDRILDTFYEIIFAKDVDAFDSAVVTLKFALSLEKTAGAAE